MVDKPREVALKILYNIDKNNAYSNIVVDEEIKKNSRVLNNKDKGFISEIVYGTTSWRLTIDEIIKKYSNIKIKKISLWILNILRMSIYQIIFLEKVPKSAAVNEGVNLAKRYGHRASSSFVNAILRKVSKKDYEELFNIEDNVERISKTTSMPIWIIKELLKKEDISTVEKICRNSNIKPVLSIRVNTLNTDLGKLQAELEKDGIIVKKGNVENFLILENAKNIESVKAFREGKFTVQDEAAGLIAAILNPVPNEKVLDACSSPGGKTTFLAQLMKNEGEIIAWDLYQHRINLVEENSRRLGNEKIIKTEVKDATEFDEKYFEYFDKILLDVPCMGSGVLKRKPDIKWQRELEDLEEISKLQYNIINNCSKYLKRGGEIVYSTCSIFKEENEDIINDFLKNNENFKIEDLNKNNIIEKIKNKGFEQYIKKEGYIQIYQNEKTDGFFICKLIKI